VIDGRLLVPAGGAWLASAAVLAGSSQVWSESPANRQHFAVVVMWISGLLLLAATGYWAASMISRLPQLPNLLLVAAVGACSGGFAAAMHVQALSSPPVSDWVAESTRVTITGVAGEEPIARTQEVAWGDVSSARMRVATSVVVRDSDNTRVEVDLPMSVEFADTDVVAVITAGAEVVIKGRLVSPFTPHEYAATVRGATLMEVVGKPGAVDLMASSMRSGLRDSLENLDDDSASLVAGLAVGDESRQPRELEESMRTSGLTHLTAVSGGNVAIVLAAVLGIAALFRASLAVRVGVALVALVFFVMLVRPQPSVLRASVMGAVVLVGLLWGGRRAGPAVLSGAVLVLMILAAPLALSWGFALSVLATAGLILAGPWVKAVLSRIHPTALLPDGVRTALAITVAAQVGALPVLAAMGTSGGPIAVPANLLAMPAVPAVTVLGLLAALLSGPLPYAASFVAWLAGWPAGWIATVAHRSADASTGSWPLPPGWWGTLTILLLLAVSIWALNSRTVRSNWQGIPVPGRRVVTAATCAVIALWILAPADRRSWPPPNWILLACDVGQGDALIIRQDSAVVVVDAGPDPTRADDCLRGAGVTDISTLVVSHFHRDHVGGISGVLAGRNVAQILGTPLFEPAEEYQKVHAAAVERGMSIQTLTAGGVVRTGAITLTALWPKRIIRSGSAPNNASLVVAVEVEGLRVLLTGDIEPEAQAAIMAAPGNFDIAKVPHHGSRNQHPRFAAWASASVAFITVGADNDYGHPAAETIAAWSAGGSRILRTDTQLDIAIVRTGQGWGTVTRST
jgi:competence protein ComEC